MRVPEAPRPASVPEAIALQERLALKVRVAPLASRVRLLAGLDAAYRPVPGAPGAVCHAAVVLWDLQSGEAIEQSAASCPAGFPYIPGLLAFRELPGLLAALAGLRLEPEALVCDGHGLAHPRRFGLACALGLLLDLPTVGCAKNPLIGSWKEPHRQAGSRTALIENGQRIGTVLRTRAGARPLFVSVGHLMSLSDAEDLVLACALGHRLPEPLRLAHLLARARATRPEG